MTLDEHGFNILKRDINPKSFRWCFTWNNYDECENWDLQLHQLMEKLGVLYYCYGKEVAPTTGTKHLQGYFRSGNRIYKNTLTAFNINWHVECAKGSESDNIKYCSKVGDFTEKGSPIKAKSKSALMIANQLQKKKEERKLEKRMEMTEFLDAIKYCLIKSCTRNSTSLGTEAYSQRITGFMDQ